MSYNPQNPNGQATSVNSAPVVIASDQSAVAVAGTVTVQQATATNLKVDLSGTAANATAIKVDGSAVTQPVSAASLPLPAGAATSAKQSDGSHKTQVVDGSGNVIGATANALDVNIKSGASSSTQYAEGATTATATGTLAMGKNGTSLKAVQTDSSGNLVVKGSGTFTVDGSGVTQPVSAASLPLPSGAATSANQTTANTSLSSIDTKTPSLGQTVMASSVPVAIASNQSAVPVSGTVTANMGTVNGLALDATLTGGTQKSKITDGTQEANTVAGDSGQNTLLTAGSRKEVSFTTTSAQAVASTDVSNYRWISVQITGQGTSSTVTFQSSNDNSNWVSTVLYPSTGGNTVGAASATTNGIWHGPVSGRYFRLNVTGISAGTTAGVVEFNSIASLTPSLGVSASATQSGTWTVTAGTVAGVVAQASTTSGQSGMLTQGAVTTSAPSYTTAQTSPISLTTAGALRTDSSAVTQPVSGTITASNTAGDVASGSSDSGNPVKIGAVGHTAAPTAVTDGQRVNLIADKVGKQVVVGSIRDLKGVQKTTITSSTAETTIVTAVASTFLDLYGLIIANTSATVCNVTIKDSTAGTTRFIFAVPANDTRGFMLPESAAHNQATVNNNWTATCGTSVASIEITAMFVKNI